MNKLKKMGEMSGNQLIVEVYVKREAGEFFQQAVKMMPGYKSSDAIVAKIKLKKITKSAVFIEGQEGIDYFKFKVVFDLYTGATKENILSQLDVWKLDGWIIDYEVTGQ